MKHLITLALVFCALQASAVDRIVEEFGVAPAFPNIASAVTAAEDGDRIIIKNRAGDIPWIETISVNKSLEFLSFQDNGFFTVQGNWTITPSNGRVIRIIGMRNTFGNITFSGSASVSGTSVSIIDCQFVVGSIQLGTDFIKTTVVGSEFQAGTVRINYGSVIGCRITSTSTLELINMTPTSAVFQGDTASIVGNQLVSPTGNVAGIYVDSRAQVVHIRNNYVRHQGIGIWARGGNVQGITNQIWNNTVVATGNNTPSAIFMSNTIGGSVWEVMNNVVTFTGGTNNRGIYNGGALNGQTNVYFNVVESSLSTTISTTGFTFVGNNITDQAITVQADGRLPAGSAAIDGGNPAAPFFDLDLTFGDAGAYGGSYTLDNFFPLHTGAARIYMGSHPYNIRQGATLRVKANAWDR
ncbi:MAG: hypothetical protein WEC15_01235 [Flavobacteriales bacterium]